MPRRLRGAPPPGSGTGGTPAALRASGCMLSRRRSNPTSLTAAAEPGRHLPGPSDTATVRGPGPESCRRLLCPGAKAGLTAHGRRRLPRRTFPALLAGLCGGEDGPACSRRIVPSQANEPTPRRVLPRPETRSSALRRAPATSDVGRRANVGAGGEGRSRRSRCRFRSWHGELGQQKKVVDCTQRLLEHVSRPRLSQGALSLTTNSVLLYLDMSMAAAVERRHGARLRGCTFPGHMSR